MDKTVHLKDGTEVQIRPMTRDDLDRSFTFFKELPEDDRRSPPAASSGGWVSARKSSFPNTSKIGAESVRT